MVSEALALSSEPTLLLGRYRPIRPLGSGGSGAVWLAADERSEREVVVKIVSREGKSGSRARREAQAMARLDHERCLRVFACGRDGDNVYIVYEFVPGRTFREVLRSGELSDADAIEAAAQVLEGLAHAHRRGIVHRDVKPANVLLADGDGTDVRLLDFGLARFAEAETLTSAGDVPGTLAYIAPERLHGEPATPAGDVWSVGVLLHEALSGRHPFWRTSLAETADAIAAGAAPLRKQRPDLPQAVLTAVDRALALEPSKRPSAAKLARQLRRASGQPATSSPAAVARRAAPAALAGLYAGFASALVPFFPVHAPPLLGIAIALLAYFRPRVGIAAALAVPVLPLGNVGLGLSWLYGAIACAWVLAFLATPSAGRRALGAATAVTLVPVFSALQTGEFARGIVDNRSPLAVAADLSRAAPHALVYEVPALAAAALVLPWVLRFCRRLPVGRLVSRTYTG